MEVEFVNDWSELESALSRLTMGDLLEQDPCECYDQCYGHDAFMPMNVVEAIDVITEYVPRLLQQYTELLRLSFTLTDAWDAEHAHRSPQGLIIP